MWPITKNTAEVQAVLRHSAELLCVSWEKGTKQIQKNVSLVWTLNADTQSQIQERHMIILSEVVCLLQIKTSITTQSFQNSLVWLLVWNLCTPQQAIGFKSVFHAVIWGMWKELNEHVETRRFPHETDVLVAYKRHSDEACTVANRLHYS